MSQKAQGEWWARWADREYDDIGTRKGLGQDMSARDSRLDDSIGRISGANSVGEKASWRGQAASSGAGPNQRTSNPMAVASHEEQLAAVVGGTARDLNDLWESALEGNP